MYNYNKNKINKIHLMRKKESLRLNNGSFTSVYKESMCVNEERNDFSLFLHEIKELESAYINSVIIRKDGSACISTKQEKFQDVQKMLTQAKCNVSYANPDINYLGLPDDVEMVKKTFNILYETKYISEDDHKAILGALLDCKNVSHSITTFVKKNLRNYDVSTCPNLSVFGKQNNFAIQSSESGKNEHQKGNQLKIDNINPSPLSDSFSKKLIIK